MSKTSAQRDDSSVPNINCIHRKGRRKSSSDVDRLSPDFKFYKLSSKYESALSLTVQEVEKSVASNYEPQLTTSSYGRETKNWTENLLHLQSTCRTASFHSLAAAEMPSENATANQHSENLNFVTTSVNSGEIWPAQATSSVTIVPGTVEKEPDLIASRTDILEESTEHNPEPDYTKTKEHTDVDCSPGLDSSVEHDSAATVSFAFKPADQMAELNCPRNQSVSPIRLPAAARDSNGKDVLRPDNSGCQSVTDTDMDENPPGNENLENDSQLQPNRPICANKRCIGQIFNYMPENGGFKCENCLTTTCFERRQFHYANARMHSANAISLMNQVKENMKTSSTKHDSLIVTCKSSGCGGWCFVSHRQLGCFECPFCNKITCVSCDCQHYPFACSDGRKLSQPTISKEEWQTLLVEAISCSFQVKPELFRLIGVFDQLKKELMESRTWKSAQTLHKQMSIIRSSILDLTGADPTAFLWYNTLTVRLQGESMVNDSIKLETTKLDLKKLCDIILYKNEPQSLMTNLQLFRKLLGYPDGEWNNFQRKLTSGKLPPVYDIVGLYRHVNHELKESFETEKAKLINKYGVFSPEATPVWLYHGTSPNSVQSIFDYNFDLQRCKRMSYGPGIYFSKMLLGALTYARNPVIKNYDKFLREPHLKKIPNAKDQLRYVIMCKVLTGASKVNCLGSRGRQSDPRSVENDECNCDSHEIPFLKYLVVRNAKLILPMYEIIVSGARRPDRVPATISK